MTSNVKWWGIGKKPSEYYFVSCIYIHRQIERDRERTVLYMIDRQIDGNETIVLERSA